MASSPLVEWRPNRPGTPTRSLDDALEMAARHGVDVRDGLFCWREVQTTPAGVLAYYGPRLRGLEPTATLSWERWYLSDDDQVMIRIGSASLMCDDEILAVLAHEAHEVAGLEIAFRESGGLLTVATIHGLIDPIVGKLHADAWDRADAIIRALQEAGRYPWDF